ncbi:MAG: PQQ-binding-like beta-propeller repeat protein [Blastocatellales bacterium]|nr:PQQ-binding-like beta-propeller repeat protein [Blastocatellales bacterium]
MRAISVLLLGALTMLGGTDWPQWRGPHGLGVSSETNLPVEWSPTKNIRWKTAIRGRGHSSPIIWGNRIFLTSSIEGPLIPGQRPVKHTRAGTDYVHPDSVGGEHKHTLKVIALDRDTGKILWERTAYEGPVFDDRHRKNNYASSTPVTDGERVYAFFEAEGLYCYDFQGKQLWRASVGKIAKMGLGHGISPILYGDLVIVQCDQEDGGESAGSFIAALDKKTGKSVWRSKRIHRKTWATPLLVDTGSRSELIASGAETVIAYDPATGSELWRSDGVKGHAIPSAVAADGMVYLSAGYPTKRTIAIKLGGTGDVTASGMAWSYDKGTAYVASPILYQGYLYLTSDKGILTCFDARTGELKYEGGRVPVPASFTASPVAYEGRILMTSEDGDTFVIKAGPQHEVLGTNSVGEPVFASPAISAGRIFIRGAQHLFCIENQG